MPGAHVLVIDDSPTLLKLVEIALTKAGYRVDGAPDGNSGLALVREMSTIPDLVLLDGMIPGVDPAEICRRLAGDDALAKVPVVVMAAERDDLEARFAKAPNVVDYISKPFSPEELQALVSQVLNGTRGQAGARDSASASPAVADALSRSTGPAARPILEEGDALAGDLAVIQVGDVLEILQDRAHTGTLRIVDAKTSARVDVAFRSGRIDFAAATGVAEEFLLGRFAVEAGGLTPQALAAVVEERSRAATKPPLFGEDLVARGLLTPAELGQAMIRQTTELVCETLRWTEGHFHFRRGLAEDLPALARAAALEISVDRLLLEGFRRVDEWRVIEQDIGSFDEIFVRNEHKIDALPRGTFTRDELAVLEVVSGKSSVRDIVRALRMGSFDVTKVLFRLLRAKLIRRRVGPVAI